MTELTVLVVDADPAAAAALAASLEASGFEAYVAITGSAACAVAHRKHLHTAVVVADLSDSQWRHWVKQLHGAAPRTWLLVVTPGASNEMTGVGHGLGADGVLPAPVDLHALRDRLRSLSVRRRPSY